MNWINKHLNWTYVIVFAISLIVLIPTLVIGDSVVFKVIGCVIFIILNLEVGGWILWQKGQSLWYLATILVSIVFIFVVLSSKNVRAIQQDKKNTISEDSYYKNR